MFIKKIRHLHYKELFIYGAFITIMCLGVVGTTFHLIRGEANAYGGFFYVISTFLIFKFAYNSKNLEKSAILLFWVSAISEYIFIYINSVDFDIIFAILIPIIAFIAMRLKQIIINLTLFYTILTAILIYYYYQYPNHHFLHNSKYMFAYFLTNVFMVAYGFFYYFAITESIKRLEASNKQNKLLLKEVHHRVKNNLNLMGSILGLQALKSNCPILKNALNSSRRRIESMATLHEVLYKSNAKESLNLKDYIDKLVINIIQSESSMTKVKPKCQIDSIHLTLNSMIQFGIMLNEMVTNSIKYAKNEDGIVKIDVKFKTEPIGYRFVYCDNSPQVDIKKLKQGFGFNLIKLTVEHFNGKMTISTNKGLCYSIFFKELEE